MQMKGKTKLARQVRQEPVLRLHGGHIVRRGGVYSELLLVKGDLIKIIVLKCEACRITA